MKEKDGSRRPFWVAASLTPALRNDGTMSFFKRGWNYHKNKNYDGSLNVSGKRIKELRKALSPKVSQKGLADILQLIGLDIDKNAVLRIESGERFITDIELRAFTKALNTNSDYLLGLTDELR